MKQEFYPTDMEDHVRIDKYLAEACPDLSRSYIQKLLKSGQVLVNGSLIKSSYVVAADDHIEVDVPEAVEPEIEAGLKKVREQLKLYEDDAAEELLRQLAAGFQEEKTEEGER